MIDYDGSQWILMVLIDGSDGSGWMMVVLDGWWRWFSMDGGGSRWMVVIASIDGVGGD